MLTATVLRSLPPRASAAVLALLVASPFAAPIVTALATPARADTPEPAYLDDRSTPEALLRSLYNAIDRKEYARAYAYFNESAVPAYDRFVAGYADTASVEVAIGKVMAEGAAGSTYWSVPVAIRARKANGRSDLFAGCYTLRLAQPGIQSPPFRGIHIEDAKLKRAGGGPLENAVPKSCAP